MQTISRVRQSGECEVDGDLDKDDLEVGCSSHVHADLASVLHVDRTLFLPHHNTLLPRQETAQQLPHSLVFALGEHKTKKLSSSGR